MVQRGVPCAAGSNWSILRFLADWKGPPYFPAVHELALMESVVTTVLEAVQDARVVRLRLEVGRLTAVVPDALRFCFDVCVKDTSLEGATLEIEETPGRVRCRACNEHRELLDPLEGCPCGSLDLEILGGHQLRIRDVEVI